MRAISQELLDDFAIAWSRLDRARPRTRTELPVAVDALADWVRRAVDLEDLLVAVMGLAYMEARGGRAGGPALVGLRHVWALMRDQRPLDELVVSTPGREALFWELYWAPYTALPAPPLDGRVPEQEEAYQAHLEGRAVRTPASNMTTFLLSLMHDARRAAAAAPPAVAPPAVAT